MPACRTYPYRRGMALASAILMSMIMLVLGLAFLYYLERDYNFAGHQEVNQEAYYLALAGLQYQRTHTNVLNPITAGTVTKDISVDRHFVVKVAPDGTITSEGIVEHGLTSAHRLLVVPPGQPVRNFVDQSR